MRDVLSDVGLRVASVSAGADSNQRAFAYEADVVYGTIREFAFDYLKQLIASQRQESTVIRRRNQTNNSVPDESPYGWDCLIIDEADSLLIDEARTPLIISQSIASQDTAAEACYRWAAPVAAVMSPQVDYELLSDSGTVALTERGRRRFYFDKMPLEMRSLTLTEIQHTLEIAIWAKHFLVRDQHYVVTDQCVRLVDEHTGRASGQRMFAQGIQQSIEARENIPLTTEGTNVAQVLVPDFISRFQHVSGMTGTAREDQSEFQSVYQLDVQSIPEFVPNQRRLEPMIVTRTAQEKYSQIVQETRELISRGRSCLIGARTIQKSEQLARVFSEAGLKVSLLTAKNPHQEASIIASAGQPGRITIATNMAGRGTDIQLDSQVAKAGGLHVIVSELHAAARIDRQLIGRSARQGDPGSARVYASLDDEILDFAYGKELAARLRASLKTAPAVNWQHQMLRAQSSVSQLHRRERARLLAHESRVTGALLKLGLHPHLSSIRT
jgi:preprotein translocase subunit SecA